MGYLQKPSWVKIKYKHSDKIEEIKSDVKKKGLATVCQESLCPNISECWNSGTATFMLMGEECTRGCRFCHVKTALTPKPLDPEEPRKLLDSVKSMNLTYVVLTSVDRDDLPDQGSKHLALSIKMLKKNIPNLKVEILIPDFRQEIRCVKNILDANPDVIAHNVETVKRLTPIVRDRRAGYDQSLAVLKSIKILEPNKYTKSSIMLGFGETETEIVETMKDLRNVGVSFLTIGQYLQPSKKQIKVKNYIKPEIFKKYKNIAKQQGFLYVASGTFVRSSYKAGELFITAMLEKRGNK